MTRVLLIALFALALGTGSTVSLGQVPGPAAAASQAGISPEQARAALDVLNDPTKRAAFAATLDAIVKAQPARPGTAAPASDPAPASAPAPAAPAQPPAAAAPAQPPAHATVEGVTIPLAPNSLGAEVLLSRRKFVSHAGNQAFQALSTVQSLPLLYGWAVVMATNPVGRDLLANVSWRAALALACAAAVAYGLRRAMRGPIRSLERLAPAHRLPGTDEAADQADPVVPDGIARAEAGEIEAPPAQRLRPSALDPASGASLSSLPASCSKWYRSSASC